MSDTAPAGARIYEGGYRRYDGPRAGSDRAFWSLWRHTLERILGLRRPARSKVLPVLSIVIAYLPPAVFVGLAAFLPDRLADATLPDYPDTYGFISAAITLFVTFVAPEALCPDRRSGVLSLYLASPLRRDTYLLAKATAVFTVLLFVTLGPPLLLLVGLTLQDHGPDGLGDLLVTFVRIAVSGAAMAAVYTGLSVAVASLTDRRAWAAAITFVFMSATAILAGILVFQLDFPDEFIVVSVTRVPAELVQRVFGETEQFGDTNVSTVVIVAGALAWTAAGAAVAEWRYRRLQVTR